MANFKVIKKKYYKKLRGKLKKYGNFVIQPFEKYYLGKSKEPNYPPIFIVGPARSGTTLIYQALINYYKLAYFPNLASMCYKTPVMATSMVHRFGLEYSEFTNYKSKYGKISGLGAPSQGYEIWRRWFPKGEYTGPESKKQVSELLKTIGGVEQYYQAPFINKWPAFSVYIPELANIFPEAFFIRVTRDYAETAQSVLRGRIRKWNNPQRSITQLPKNVLAFQQAPPEKQVAAYVLGIEAQVSNDLAGLDTNRKMTITYEDFCNDPMKYIRHFREKYEESSDFRLEARGIEDIAPFSVSRSKKVSELQEKAIDKHLKELQESGFFEKPAGGDQE